MIKTTPLLFAILCSFQVLVAQTDSTAEKKEQSKFDKFNEKGEALFKVIPVPLYSYSTEAGHIFGLAKYNLVNLNKNDTISQPSKLSELITFSTEGRLKVAVGTDLIWNENKYMVLGYITYNKQTEYIFGTGNNIDITKPEKFDYSRFHFVNTGYVMLYDNLYLGAGFDISDYTEMKYDTTGYLSDPDIIGIQPNTNFGLVLAILRDYRDNRYNAFKGSYFKASYTFHPSFLTNLYTYQRFTIDARKYFNPWLKHVIALQVAGEFCSGDVPFYDLALLGGDSQMRGYYQGALRDNILVDTQIEYRMPIWNIFGMVGWVGTGRVANEVNDLSIDGFRLSYGLGLRIKVDSENDTNLRFDFGFGEQGVSGFYINFSEAF